MEIYKGILVPELLSAEFLPNWQFEVDIYWNIHSALYAVEVVIGYMWVQTPLPVLI